MKDSKQWFGAIIVIILLGLYSYSLCKAMTLACGQTDEALPEGISRTLATVGGLVSALVIAKLAVTTPGSSLAAGFIDSTASPWLSTAAEIIAWLYVLIWILLGLAAFVVGELWFPGKVPALTTFAQAWLGLAVASGYAYFGLKN